MILMLESFLMRKMSNYMAKGLETILEAKILKFSVRKEQDRLTGKNENVFSYGQVENWVKFSICKILDKMRMLR